MQATPQRPIEPRGTRAAQRCGLLALLCLMLGAPTALSAQEPEAPAQRLEAPPLPAVGAPSILVTKSGVRFVDASRGGPIATRELALAEAIRRARPGDVIGVQGQFGAERPIQVGGGTRGMKGYRADWKGRAIRDLTIVGLDPGRTTVIAGLELWQTYGDGSVSGGVESLRLQNLSLRASEHTRQPIIIPKGQTIGRLTVVDCNFRGAIRGGYKGFGQKWGIRSAGRGSFDIRNSHCEKVQEHFLYLDSPQGDNFFIGLSMEKSWRTMIQLVNRSKDNPGPAGAGRVLIEDCHASGIRGEGGGAFTIAGHLGQVVLRNCSVRESGHAAVVVWSDASPAHGVYLTRAESGQLYSTQSVEIDGLEVDLPDADRALLQVSGCRDFVLRNFSISGNQTGLALDTRYGIGPIEGPQNVDGKEVKLERQAILNGRVRIEPGQDRDSVRGFHTPRAVTQGERELSAQAWQALGQAAPESAPASDPAD